MVAAQNEARAAGNDQIRHGTPHPRAAEPSRRRSAARTIIAQGVPWRGPAGSRPRCCRRPRERCPRSIPFDQQAKKTLELTFREALRLGHNYIGTEHILLALLELEDGSGLLTGLGIDKTATEANITATVAAIAARKEQN